MYTDKALNLKREDELDRYKFAEQIAVGIVQSLSQNSEGLVIGITGAWGTGKSTLVNFVTTEIEKLHEENENLFSPVILKFNPWMFSGQQELQLIFLKELYSRFRLFDSTLEKASKKLQKFLEKLHFLKYVHPSADEIIKGTSKALETFSTESSLEELKKEIDQILIETETKVYITIDDIDRLTPNEVAEILQLVKLNGNFANTTFILSYDDEVVQNSMGTVFGDFGKSYLEKIVQVDYSIPFLSDERKAKILKKRFKDSFKKNTLKSNQEMIDDIVDQPYFDLLKSIRDINRLLNSVKLRLPLVESEIYAPDFVLIEAFRSFCPNGFKFMYSSKSELFKFSESKMKSGIDFSKEKVELTAFINSAEIEDSAKQILVELFVPNGSHQLQADISNKKFITSRRVIHKYYFDRYFSLELGEREVSEKDFLRFEKSKRVGRHRILKEVTKKDHLALFLRWLPLKVKLNDNQRKLLFADIYSFSDKTNFHDQRLFSNNHDFWLITQFSSQFLEKMSDLKERRQAILAFLNEKRRKANFYMLPLCVDILLAKEKFDENKLYGNDRWFGLFSEEDSENSDFAEKIKERFVHSIKRILRRLNGSFEDYNADEVNYILVKSQHFVPEKYVNMMAIILKKNEQLLDLLTICIGKKIMTSGSVSGYCLEREGLFLGMEIHDIYNKISSIKNLESFDQDRIKSAKFYLKVYDDNFPHDTYYDYDSLNIVSTR
jgi:hypothetical protein